MKQALLFCSLLFLLTISINAQTVQTEKAISVAAGDYTSLTFNDATRLWGRFKATGGKNDIECYILDGDGFENFKNGNQFRYIYFSGRVTVDTFDKTLDKGTYYLVFNNRWAVITPKSVNITFYQ